MFKDIYSDEDDSHFVMRSYPLSNSSTIPVRANEPVYWSRSESSASVYPDSSNYDDDDDADNWSDTFEEVSDQGAKYLKTFTDNDDDKTPICNKRFSISDLYDVAMKLDQCIPREEQDVQVLPIAIKETPAVAMKNLVQQNDTSETDLSLARSKKSRAPDPPVVSQPQPLPESTYSTSLTGGLPIKRLSRVLNPGTTTGPISIKKPPMSFLEETISPNNKPSVSTQPTNKTFIKEKPSPFKNPFDDFDAGLDSQSSSRPLSPVAEPGSPSTHNRCPHCTLHSWLPHSSGCPKKKP